MNYALDWILDQHTTILTQGFLKPLPSEFSFRNLWLTLAVKERSFKDDSDLTSMSQGT